MSETGQPGAATPGEHGDGTGQQDDLARSVSGWAPPAAGWSGADAPAYREPASPWRHPDPPAGWGASSPRHGDLPAPLSSPPADDPAPRNGRAHLNGVGHAEGDLPGRPAPVSAPPADPPRFGPEARRDPDGDRLVVPAQRPAPPGEQQSEPDASARHASEEPSAGRVSPWAEGMFPSSAPPAVQVPPVGTAASGFEVPPGFHAPQTDRAEAEPSPVAEPPSWADRFGAEPTGAAPVEADRRGSEPVADRRPTPPADEPDWSGPNWNRPSWGGSPATSWSREEQPGGRQARAGRTPEWAAEPNRPYEPVRSEPARSYEPARSEPARPYEVSRSEPEPPVVPEPAVRPVPAPTEEPAVDRPTRDRSPVDLGAPDLPAVDRAAVDRPDFDRPVVQARAWAGGPSATAPRSAPPAPAEPTPVRTPSPDPTPSAERVQRPFRLRSVPGEAAVPPDLSGHPPTLAGPGSAVLAATSGPRRLDPTSSAPAPTSAPPYAARRSAPDPEPTTEPAVDDGRSDRGSAVLPQRVPAEPDVPVVPEPPAVEPPAETPELARIATHLRRDDEPAPLRERPEGFDVNAILDAVREVAGVRDAALRRTPAGAHSLRLDLSDGADPAEVSRMVARLLQERMGLAAAPQNLPGAPATPTPPLRRRAAETRAAEGRAAETRTAEARAREARPAEGRAAETRAAESRLAEPRGADARAGETRSRTRDADVRPTDPRATVRDQEPRAGGPSSPARAADPLAREDRPVAGAGFPGAPSGSATPAGSGEPPAETVAGVPRRRRQTAIHRGRASVEEVAATSAPPAAGSPATVGTSYSGGQMTTTETAPSRPLHTGGVPGPRVVIDHVQVSTLGLDATVQVRLLAGGETAAGHSTGPAVDGYVLRLCAVAAAAAVDQLLHGSERTADRGRCFVEHTAVVPFGNCEVATVVVLLVCDGWVEQLAGSALVAGDPRQAVVRATLAAVNRRLEALLA